MKTRRTFLALMLASLPAAFGAEPLYFESVEKAVATAGELLRKNDWPTLARYYDLAGSDVKAEDLENGEFFIRKERPANADPAGFWKTKHPFPPGFTFDRVEKTDDAAVMRVHVKIEIDQGGGPKQRSLASFAVRKSAKGFQILPPKK
jgi:hypothetical protein